LIPTLGLLAAFSLPGGDALWLLPSALLIFLAAICWWVIAATSARKARKDYPVDRAWRFSIAPIAGILVLVLVWGRVPLWVRWKLSESSFEHYVATARAAGARDEWIDLTSPGSLGLYSISHIDQVGEAIIFYESHGVSFSFERAGFAYLPNGPFDELSTTSFEAPKFWHLGGPWYSFIAGPD
jgi:hypothetical protein